MPSPHGNTKQWPPNKHREALHLLKDKVIGSSSPSSLNVDSKYLDDLFNHRPEDLPDAEGTWYFTHLVPVGRGWKRSSKFGRWHAPNQKREITDREGRQLGFVRRLIYKLKGSPEQRTKWGMMEYTLDKSRIPTGVNELALCIIYKTKDYKRNKTASGDAGPSNDPFPEPVLQAENHVPELTDLPFSDWLASLMQAENQVAELTGLTFFDSLSSMMQAEHQVAELTGLPFLDCLPLMESRREPPMDFVYENDQWFEDIYEEPPWL